MQSAICRWFSATQIIAEGKKDLLQSMVKQHMACRSRRHSSCGGGIRSNLDSDLMTRSSWSRGDSFWRAIA